MSSYKLRNAVCYIGMAAAVYSLLPDEPSWNHWVSYVCVWLLFLVVDVDSYASGMNRGCEISREAMDAAISALEGRS